MTHFSSLPTVPAETRRTLRQRFHRYIPSTYVHPVEPTGSTHITDELFLQLLTNLTVDFTATHKRASAIYCEALVLNSTEESFDALIDKGWIQLIWGRISIPFEVAEIARNSPPDSMPSYHILLDQRFRESYIWNPSVYEHTQLTDLVNRINSDDLRIVDISCQTPSWVAARLWDRLYSATSDPSCGLRLWVDRWNLLVSPHIEVAQAWNEHALTAFRDSVFHTLSEDSSLCAFADFRNELIKRVALTNRQTLTLSDEHIPDLPTSLVERALWLRDLSIERLVDEKYFQLEDFAHLILLLESEITNAEYSSAPHPTFLRLVDLAIDRAPILLILLIHAERNPLLVAELLLHPPTSALACLLIAQWQSPTSAWDRALLEKDNQANKLIAFSDAVSVLHHYLNEQKIHPSEVAALLRWFHHSLQTNADERKTNLQQMLTRLTSELVRQPQSTMVGIVDTLLDEPEALRLGTPNFLAALDAASIGKLADAIDPVPLTEGYLNSFIKDEGSLSAGGITPHTAVTLNTLAKRASDEFYQQFLFPLNVVDRLSAATDENQFTLAHDVGQSIRVHIRMLCRVTMGLSGRPPESVVDALESVIRTGAVTNLEEARVAAFSPNFEERNFFESQDRPIAADIGGVLSAIDASNATRLLNAILETDEPTLLAQLLGYCPVHIQKQIRTRIAEITPEVAAATYSLNEVQIRIDALLTAGLGEFAEKYIQDEKGLRTFGPVPGRRNVRFRQSLRAKIQKRDWEGITGAEIPEDLSPAERETARETLLFYKGVAALNNPAIDRRGAIEIFSQLHRRSPHVAAYAINLFLSSIGKLLEGNLFGSLEDHQIVDAENILADGEENFQRIQGLNKSDSDIYRCYRALLLLALGKPAQAHDVLGSLDSLGLKDTIAAFDAIAIARLGRGSEAVAMLNEATRTVGNTHVLRDAKSHIENGNPFLHISGITPDDELVPSTKEAIIRLKQMDPIQQAQVLKLWDPPFEGLVTDLMVSATSSVGNLVPAMKNLKLDSREDDITALVRELLTSHLTLLGWHVADHSHEGWSARGNPGKPDLVLRNGSTTLSVVEAVVCRDAIRDDDLRTHFHKLFGYSSCSICFLLTYTFRDVVETERRLRYIAKNSPPQGFNCVDVVDVRNMGSEPRRFYGIYSNDMGSVRVVFLVLDLKQDDRRTAARNAVARPGSGK